MTKINIDGIEAATETMIELLFVNSWLDSEYFETLRSIVCTAQQLGVTQAELINHDGLLEILTCLGADRSQSVLENSVTMRLKGPDRKQWHQRRRI